MDRTFILFLFRLYCAKYDDTATIVSTITSDVSTGYVRLWWLNFKMPRICSLTYLNYPLKILSSGSYDMISIYIGLIRLVVKSKVKFTYLRYNGGSRIGVKWTTTQNCASGKFLSSAQYLSQVFNENVS